MSGGLKPYPKTKPSGLPWLGEIPAHWDEKRGKYFFREVDQRSKTGDEELLSVSHKTGVTPRSQKNVTMFMAESYVGHKLCKPDDIVVNTMWAWAGALGVATTSGIVSPAYGVYRPLKPGLFRPEFLDNLLRTWPFVAEYIVRSTGIRSSRLRLYPDKFLDILFPFPPREEQDRIADFLSRHDRLVRRFIRNKRRLIALLNEQKQAIINQAVTRGLDPNVKLKPSGAEWLPTIPCHWEMLPNRAAFYERNVRGYEDEPLLSVTIKYGVVPQEEFLASETTKKDSSNDDKSNYKLVEPNDIAYNKMRMWQGAAGVSRQRGIISPAYIVVRLRGIWNPDYFHYLFRTPTYTTLSYQYSYGICDDQLSLRYKDFKSIYTPIPPRSEQDTIVRFIMEHVKEIDDSILYIEKEIDLIREYSIRLIADAVTGKVDIREMELPEVVGEEEEIEEDENGEDINTDPSEVADDSD